MQILPTSNLVPRAFPLKVAKTITKRITMLTLHLKVMLRELAFDAAKWLMSRVFVRAACRSKNFLWIHTIVFYTNI